MLALLLGWAGHKSILLFSVDKLCHSDKFTAMKEFGDKAKRIIQLLREGNTPKQIREIMPEATPFRISQLARRIKIPNFRAGRISSKDMANLSIRVAGMFGQGMTAAEIGEKLGISRQAAHRRLKKLVEETKRA